MITLRLPRRTGAWWELARLKTLFAPGATALGHFARPGELGFLAVNEPEARRSVVVLESAMIAFDLPLGGARLEWSLAGKAEVESPALQCGALLHVVYTAPRRPVEVVESLDLAGARIGSHLLLFRNEISMARSAVSYFLEGDRALKHLVTGLAPGSWQVWWNGWLEDPGAEVPPRAGSLYYERPAGSYFLRRLD